MVVYNPAFFDDLMNKMQAIQFSQVDFMIAATRKGYEFQESFCKVLSAVELDNHEGISLLLMEATLNLLKILAFINQQPFTTFSRYISQARNFRVKPDRLDDLLDLPVFGTYQNLAQVKDICLAVFGSVENLFSQHGIELFSDELDPDLLNRTVIHPI